MQSQKMRWCGFVGRMLTLSVLLSFGLTFGQVLEPIAGAANSAKSKQNSAGRSPAVSVVGHTAKNQNLNFPTHAEFLKLKPNQQKEVIRSVRKFLLDYERTVGQNFAEATPEQRSTMMAMLSLVRAGDAWGEVAEGETAEEDFSTDEVGIPAITPPAEVTDKPAKAPATKAAVPSHEGKGCFFAGWYVADANRCNQKMVQSTDAYKRQNEDPSCKAGQLRCNDFVFGTGVCISGKTKATFVTRQCFARAKSGSLERAVAYAKTHSDQWNTLNSGLNGVCSESGARRPICRRLKERLAEIENGVGLPATDVEEDVAAAAGGATTIDGGVNGNDADAAEFEPATPESKNNSKLYCCTVLAKGSFEVNEKNQNMLRLGCAGEYGKDVKTTRKNPPVWASESSFDTKLSIGTDKVCLDASKEIVGIFYEEDPNSVRPKPLIKTDGELIGATVSVGCKFSAAPIKIKDNTKAACDDKQITENFKELCFATIECGAFYEPTKIEGNVRGFLCEYSNCANKKIGDDAHSCVGDASTRSYSPQDWSQFSGSRYNVEPVAPDAKNTAKDAN